MATVDLVKMLRALNVRFKTLMDISIELDLGVLLRVHHSPFAPVISRVGRAWLPVALC
jgi:hypothetical protein